MAAETQPETESKTWGGIALDIAGIVAAVIIAAVLIDIWTDGRLRRRTRPAADREEETGEPDTAGT